MLGMAREGWLLMQYDGLKRGEATIVRDSEGRPLIVEVRKQPPKTNTRCCGRPDRGDCSKGKPPR